MMSVISRDHKPSIKASSSAPAEIDAVSATVPVGETEWAHRRSIVGRLLWGSSVEFCAECGKEVLPRDAYRDSLQKTYCSVEHANRDRA